MVLAFLLSGLIVCGAGGRGGAGSDAASPSFRAGPFELTRQDPATGLLGLRIDGWDGFSLGGLRPSVRLDGTERAPGRCRFEQANGSLRVTYDFPGRAQLILDFSAASSGGLRLQGSLRNTSPTSTVTKVLLLIALRLRSSRRQSRHYIFDYFGPVRQPKPKPVE